MKKLNGRELKALFVLSIVVPVGLLTTFRLTGILQEPITITETTTLEAIKWEFEPILYTTAIDDGIEGTYNNDEISMVQRIFIPDYKDKTAWDSDTLTILMNVTAFVKNGHVNKVNLTFQEDYENSTVDLFYGIESLVKLRNLSIISYQHLLKDNVKAFFEASNVNRSSSVYLWLPADWVLRSINRINQTRLLEITSEVTYFNGTAYKKIIQPFQLKIRPDDNNSFDKAEEIGLGTHKAYINRENDPEDYYKIWLEQGQVLKVEKAYPRVGENWPDDYPVGLDIYIYAPDMNLKTSLIYGTNAARQVTFTADSSGWWYIQVKNAIVNQVYLLNLSTPTNEGD